VVAASLKNILDGAADLNEDANPTSRIRASESCKSL